MLLELGQKGDLKINVSLSNKAIETSEHIILMVKIFCVYVFVPIIGTLLHELGHFLVAVLNGYKAQIHYSYTTTSINPVSEEILYFFFILGGPLSTWIQCIIPFTTLLLLYNKKQSREILENSFFNINFLICLIFISMGARFIFNLITYVITPSNTIDEYIMADIIKIHPETFLILFALIYFAIFLVSLYKIPKTVRLTFLVGALSGSTFGYFLWYFLLGPALLP